MSFDFVAIDFETANNNYSSACSLGIVGVKNNEIYKKDYFLIHPPTLDFSEKNISINGITPKDIENAPLFPEIWNNINSYFDDNILIAHNAAFDMSVLKNCLSEYDLSMPDFNYICSIPISTRLCRGKGIGKSLEDRANYFGIDLGHHHNSLDDAMACANLVIECIKRAHRKTLESFCHTYVSLPIKNFADLHPRKELMGKSNKSTFAEHRFNTVKVSEIKSTNDNIDPSNPFYNKSVVFTGDLECLSRKEAMQKIADWGGILKSSVSKKTDYLIIGIQDKSLVGDDGMSNKEEKAYILNEKGYSIKILNETEFLNLINIDKDTKNNALDLDSIITFNNLDDRMDKLKEWKLLSPKAEEEKDIYYKNKDITYKCEIIGYLNKKTNSNCIDRFYETVVIKFDNDIIKISPAFLLEMQKKDFSSSYNNLQPESQIN
ncbi:exonuclease domain-containing protein [Clostridium tyrobutyricum]|uniref:exonuclease domain-containing protein n=1 Tax=Clostridium tyrobutyricum TaxID=1519 RepID=UPI0010AB1130|nr:exonuclease domain-containing protein [Clostridium tyrobutyricum]QCH27957.1 DNA polymerase III PolC-type [Clostridium tyrobutyricum]